MPALCILNITDFFSSMKKFSKIFSFERKRILCIAPLAMKRSYVNVGWSGALLDLETDIFIWAILIVTVFIVLLDNSLQTW